MAHTVEYLLEVLNSLYPQLITDRTQTDVDYILALGFVRYDDMSAEQKAFITNPQKGAYNTTDRNRVGTFCNTFVELMADHFGTLTLGYETMRTNWESVSDPTQEELSKYIGSLLTLRDKWYSYFAIPSTVPVLSQIYDGISLETANNIEQVLKKIFETLRDCVLPVSPRYSGQLYGPDSSSIISSGMDIWMRRE